MSLADVVKFACHRVGIEVARHRPPGPRRQALITAAGVATVLDVGANTGQYVRALRADGFTGHVVSFEPQSAAFGPLEAAAAHDPRWSCHRLALSASSGTGTLRIAGNSASSSLLAMTPLHGQAAPGTETVGEEDVPLARLDEVAAVRGAPGPLMLKLDVQGHELDVLAGATSVLGRVVLVEAELSVRELYHGAPSLRRVLDELAGHGFELAALEPGFHDPRDGTILQFDGLFRRAAAGSSR